jgi:hypothetical protein
VFCGACFGGRKGWGTCHCCPLNEPSQNSLAPLPICQKSVHKRKFQKYLFNKNPKKLIYQHLMSPNWSKKYWHDPLDADGDSGLRNGKTASQRIGPLKLIAL